MVKRVGGSYWRIGVWGSKTAFRHGYNDQEVSRKLDYATRTRYADTFPLAGPFSTQPSGPRPVSYFSGCSLDPCGSRYGRFARALKNSQLIRRPPDDSPLYSRRYTRMFRIRELVLISDTGGGWGSVSAYWRIGVWGSKTAFRHGYRSPRS